MNNFSNPVSRRILMLALLVFSNLSLVAQPPDLYITSFQDDAIMRFDGETGAFKGNFVSPGLGSLDRPQDVFFHPNTGHLLVTGFLNSQIKMYDGESGSYLGNFSSGYVLASPTKMILGKDSLLYVSQWGGKVVRFTLDGNFAGEFTSNSIPAGLGMIWDEEDNLYVTSWGSDGFDGQVYKFNAQGNLIGTFIDSSLLDGPVGIWQDGAGDFFVVDWRIGSVLRFDSDGVFKDTFISGTDRTEGHVFGADGSIFLCNVQVNKVSRYNPDGSFKEVFIDNNLAGPNAITFGPILTATENLLHKQLINLRVYPNPFSHQMLIGFDLPTAEFVTIQVENNIGQKIATLKEGLLFPGKHQLEWDATNFPASIYFIHLNIGNEMMVEKVVLLK